MTINTQNNTNADQDLRDGYIRLHAESIGRHPDRLITYLTGQTSEMTRTDLLTTSIVSGIVYAILMALVGVIAFGLPGVLVGVIVGFVSGFVIPVIVSKSNVENIFVQITLAFVVSAVTVACFFLLKELII